MEPVEIAAGIYQLQPWAPHDAQEVFEACQDPDIQRYTTVPGPYSMADAEMYVGTISPEGWSSESRLSWSVKDATTGQVLASVGFPGFSAYLKSAELGYWCAPWARGKGVTTAAARAVCAWAFGTELVTYIGWRAVVGNLGSRAVAEKVGFSVEGTMRAEYLRKDGSREDSWYGSLLAGELIR